jgi:hypothetical protein
LDAAVKIAFLSQNGKPGREILRVTTRAARR